MRNFVIPSVRFLLIIMFLLNISTLFSQTTISNDTVLLKAGTNIIMNDTSFRILKDTIIIVPDTVEILTGRSGKQFYNKLKELAYKNKITKRLYDLAFEPPMYSIIPDSVQAVKAESPYLPYTGRIIRNINIRKLDIFGPSMVDTAKKASTWVGRFANNLHLNTRAWVIKQNLLFKKGDTLNPFIIAENTSILRNLTYIDDALIHISKIEGDSVDILVLTKDVFPIVIMPELKNNHKFYLRGYNVNLLGLGYKLDNAMTFDTERRPEFRYDLGSVSTNNINGSFVNASIGYLHNDDSLQYNVSVFRQIIPLRFKYFGGFSFKDGYRKFGTKIDTTTIFRDVNFNVYDAFFGRSFLDKERKNYLGAPITGTIGSRIQRIHHSNRPYVSADSNFFFQKRINVLFATCISKQDYLTTSYFYTFGRNEDIPYGYRFAVLGGYQFGEYFDRTYLGMESSVGQFIKKLGYVYLSCNIGGFFHNKRFEQGVLDISAIHSTNMIRIKRHRVRLYNTIRFTQALNAMPGDTLLLQGTHGFPGEYSDEFKGTKRFSFSPEVNVFTPWYFYGFRFAYFGFIDMGWIGFQKKSIFENKARTFLGAGMRIKNENLVFETVEFRLSYLLNSPDGTKPFGFSIATKAPLRFPIFLPKKPDFIAPY
ncbi:MAG: hypothetical protein ACEPOV_00370 [Hyphomicrobiales bacterium]